MDTANGATADAGHAAGDSASDKIAGESASAKIGSENPAFEGKVAKKSDVSTDETAGAKTDVVTSVLDKDAAVDTENVSAEPLSDDERNGEILENVKTGTVKTVLPTPQTPSPPNTLQNRLNK